MNDLKKIIEKYSLEPIKYKYYKKAKAIFLKDKGFIIKPKNNIKTYDYLHSRGVDFFPNYYNEVNDDYDMVEYIDGIDYPNEQKTLDIMYLTSILHNKTLFYRELDLNRIKEIYEGVNKEIDEIRDYYLNINDQIDRTQFLSPRLYLLARNISIIYYCLSKAKELVDEWYEIVIEKKRERVVLNHNNLSNSHIVKRKREYLLSWDKASIDSPIYDIYHLYEEEYKNIDFITLLEYYEQKFPLLLEEKLLLIIKLMIPKKILFSEHCYQDTVMVSNLFIFLNKALRLEKYFENKKK